MDHVMAVAAQQGQVANSSRALAALMQGFYVMAFNETLTKIPVGLFKIEFAYLAYKRSAMS